MNIETLSRLEGLINQRQLAQWLGVTPQTVCRWGREGMPCAFKMQGIALYDAKRCETWLFDERLKRTETWKWKANKKGKAEEG